MPQNLVQTDAQGFFVFLLQKHKVAKVYFTPGAVLKTGRIEARMGLTAGQQLITSNPQSLSVGQSVVVAKS